MEICQNTLGKQNENIKIISNLKIEIKIKILKTKKKTS